MEDTYVYVSVKLYIKNGQTEESVQEIIQDMDYSFVHDDIVEHEIVDILDMQLPELETDSSMSGFNEYQLETLDDYNHVDVYDLSNIDVFDS